MARNSKQSYVLRDGSGPILTLRVHIPTYSHFDPEVPRKEHLKGLTKYILHMGSSTPSL